MCIVVWVESENVVNGDVGGVYADRQLKTTRLPASLESGRVITFETELIAVNKLRVTVEVCEKVITFDWNLPQPKTANEASVMNSAGTLPGITGLGLHSFGPGLGVPGVGLSVPGAGLGVPGVGAEADKVSLYFFTHLSHPGVSVTVDPI